MPGREYTMSLRKRRLELAGYNYSLQPDQADGQRPDAADQHSACPHSADGPTMDIEYNPGSDSLSLQRLEAHSAQRTDSFPILSTCIWPIIYGELT